MAVAKKFFHLYSAVSTTKIQDSQSILQGIAISVKTEGPVFHQGGVCDFTSCNRGSGPMNLYTSQETCRRQRESFQMAQVFHLSPGPVGKGKPTYKIYRDWTHTNEKDRECGRQGQAKGGRASESETCLNFQRQGWRGMREQACLLQSIELEVPTLADNS